MAYFLLFASLLYSPYLWAQMATEFPVKRTLTIRKKNLVVPFEQALALPFTATSCDCPSSPTAHPLIKLGCQHPDTAAICKVVVTQFDVAILPPQGAAIIIKNINGSFLSESALEVLRRPSNAGAFVSYSNIEGQTTDGKTVVVPPFGSTATQQRAKRLYRSVYNFLPTVDSSHTTVHSFELLAYDQYGRMVFKQTYDKDDFDVNAVRPDAARYVFQQIRAQHESGFYVEVQPLSYHSLLTPPLDLLSTTN
ncbi:MAG: hypothetical protein ACRBFS_15785 [Aureispira sp.]